MFCKWLTLVALLWILMPAVSAGPSADRAISKVPASSPSLADTAWEVKVPDAPKTDVRLYRFDANGKFHFQALRGVFMYQSARWKAKDDRFAVAVPGIDWGASGTFTKDAIKGTVINDGKKTVFEGQRVDAKTYEFPLDEREARVIVKLRKYTLGEWPNSEEFEDYLKKADAAGRKRFDKWAISGFIFEVVGPREYRSKYITAHHDGMLASGDATKIAELGKEYVMRLDKNDIGKKNFGLCSIDLRLKLASDKRPLGPYTSGLWLLSK